MSTATMAAVPAAGWYEDPLSPSAVRWWNGRGWTEHTQSPQRPAGAFASSWATFADSPSAAPAAPPTAVLASETATATLTAPALPPELAPAATGLATETATPSTERASSRNEYIPMRGHISAAERATAAPVEHDWMRPTHWSTRGVWAMAFTPWLSAVIVFTLGVLVAVGARWYVLLAAVLLMPLLWISFAVRDRRRLAEFGYEKRASWAWVLLGPLAYLIARGARVHRVSGRGWAPLWVMLVNVLLVAGTGVGVAMVVQADLLPQQLQSLETSIAGDYASKGVAATVTCPTAGVTLLPGSSFHCTADAAGRTQSIAVHVSATGRVSYAPAGTTPGA